MENIRNRVLYIEDDKVDRMAFKRFLQTSNLSYDYTIAGSISEAKKILEKEGFDVVLADYLLDDGTAFDIFDEITVPIIIITGAGDEEIAVKAMKAGAYDYLIKDPERNYLKFLPVTLENAIEKQRLQKTERIFRQHLNQEHSFASIIIGNSSKLHEIISQARKVAATSLNVLIMGPTGTGKDMFARAIHQASDRYDAEFVTVDCGAMPESLIESELFGYERGAFTGAIKQKPGKFEIASGGTLFLDEIGNLSESAQMKLLRALAFKEIQRLGGVKSTQVDVRLLAATNVDLREAVKKGNFREDLYYRIAEFVISLPPLRERGDDILILSRYFLIEANQRLNKQVIDFEPEVKKRFTEYHWPGNVRELKNAILQATLMTDDKISMEHLPAEIRSFSSFGQSEEIEQSESQFCLPVSTSEGGQALQAGVSLRDIANQATQKAEREVIATVLSQTNGNKSEAARILNTSYKTLLDKIKKYGL